MECVRCHRPLPDDGATECRFCGGPVVAGRPTEVAGGVEVVTGQVAPPAGWFYKVRGLALSSVVLLAVAAVTAVVEIVLESRRIDLLDRITQAAPLSEGDPLLEEADRSDHLLAGVALTHLVLYVAIAVVLLCWVRNAYGNGIRTGSRLSYTTGGAVGWWFVPFVNFVRVPRIMNEIWRSSSPGVEPGNESSWRAQPGSSLVAVWWATWLIANFLARFAAGSASPAVEDSLDALRNESIANLVSDLFEVASAVALALIIRRVTLWQTARQSAVGA